ncbi:class I SAM-dependent methyltransferase [Croceicoccus mobilis]|uniref:SAM-dependent methyltransferase n=1 Tax=Croceicoccus mobilis TaxID=1703339 RepID=A0A917DQ35_9SPHN|nr:class I SAM-dependent methyltransferase [Croceicoccus mobilis]GGD59289.1 SAM-dependent methyltransferase [Croceicoccus mobilis]
MNVEWSGKNAIELTGGEEGDLAAKPCCRHCGEPLDIVLADLGYSPVANDLITPDMVGQPETLYPLKVSVCGTCWLAQAADVLPADAIFRADYTYFSSHSSTWLAHAKAYVDHMIERFDLDADSRVVEVACNDGYLLQYVKEAGIPCLGVEPTAGPAQKARDLGIEVVVEFMTENYGQALAKSGWTADLVTANNVLAHVPDINDFVRGIAAILNPEGVATFEVQHLLRLMQGRQFDTIYHEHFSYLSLLAAEKLFAAAGLRVFAVDNLPTHGGSVRFYVCRAESSRADEASLDAMRGEEAEYGLDRREVYEAWRADVQETKLALMEMCLKLKREGKTIVGYGAPAKGVTLLNYCGIGADFLDYTVDRAPSKKGCLLPGVHVPILDPSEILNTKPDYVLILPWNLKDEIMEQMSAVRDWGGKFVTPVPLAKIED